jgi:hypothetical protein
VPNGSKSLFYPEGQAAITDKFGRSFNEFHPNLVMPTLDALDLVGGNLQEGGDLEANLV